MDNVNCKRYFGASNSASGFVNYFPQIFCDRTCSRIYVIKGGPGTGKSRFMREVANEAEERGMTVRYYYCSSDADSLDGIIIEEMRIGLVDGTAPHVCEPTLVGAFEQIINLGEFWDEKKLAIERERIAELSQKKSNAYSRAYFLLSAYGGIEKAIESKLLPCINTKKLNSAVKRLLHKLPQGSGEACEIALRSSVGMSGERSFDSYERESKILFSVTDCHSTAHFVMRAILDEAKARDMSLCVSYDPIMSDRPDAIMLNDCGISFVCGDCGERVINSKRFVDEEKFREVKDGVKALESECRALRRAALQTFAEVKKYHFELEDIYISAMDFERKEQYTREFIKNLFLFD